MIVDPDGTEESSSVSDEELDQWASSTSLKASIAVAKKGPFQIYLK